MVGAYDRARQAVPIRARRCLLVRITTDEGLVGYGEGVTPLAPQAAAEVVRRVLGPFLVGRDPACIESIWDDLYGIQASSRGYNRGYEMIAIGAIDIALWDLRGKALGVPLYQLLGGKCREVLPVYATGLLLAETGEVLRLAEEYHRQGIRAMKVKIGIDTRRDLENVRALRKTFGPDLRLMLDASGAYDVSTAIRVGKAYEEVGIEWFEEPVPMENMEGMAEVRRALRMYVAAGECEFSKYGFRDLFLRRAVDVCQPNLGRAGGITECRKIAALAQAFHIHYSSQNWGGAVLIAASAHLAAAQPNFLIFEADRMSNPLRDELVGAPPVPVNGFLRPPEGPGLGVELNEEVIRKYRVA